MGKGLIRTGGCGCRENNPSLRAMYWLIRCTWRRSGLGSGVFEAKWSWHQWRRFCCYLRTNRECCLPLRNTTGEIPFERFWNLRYSILLRHCEAGLAWCFRAWCARTKRILHLCELTSFCTLCWKTVEKRGWKEGWWYWTYPGNLDEGALFHAIEFWLIESVDASATLAKAILEEIRVLAERSELRCVDMFSKH